MLYFDGLGLRKRRRKWYMLEDHSQNTRRQSKCHDSFAGAFEFKVHGILSWLGVAKHSTWNVLLGWALENTRVPHLSFLQNLKKTIHAILCWAGSSKCHICLSPAFSVLLRSVLCACLPRTRSKSLIVRASLWSTNFVRLHSRLRRDMRI